MTGLRLPKGPTRIVCLTEEPTEILYLLGEGERVVGISAYTVRPPEARRDKPVVSAFIGGSIEKIAALQPDLIIGFSDIQADLARDLIKAHLPVLIFNQRSLQEILEVVSQVGRIVGRRAEADVWVSRAIERVERLGEKSARRTERPKVYFEEWDEPMICGIHWVSELIEIAGGQDVFRDRSRQRGAKGRIVTAEQVAEAAPDIMLASWCGKPFEAEAVRSRAGMAGVPAVAQGRMIELPPEIILQPGPACLTAGLDRLEQVLAPGWQTRA